eukprot:11090117-Lingulodinium_polyedra.AAC.1
MPQTAGPDPNRNQMNCRNTTASGRVCNEPLTANDIHPAHCPCGGGVVLRHDSLAHTRGRMAADNIGFPPTY